MNLYLDLDFSDIKLSKDELIQQRKENNKRYDEIAKSLKGTNCLICGKKVDSFCKSHSLPKQSLLTIADKGNILSFNEFAQYEAEERDTGIRKAGLFFNICNECDNERFCEYENIEKYTDVLTNEQMKEMALKNVLYRIYWEKIHRKIYEQCEGKSQVEIINTSEMVDYIGIDLNEYQRALERILTNKASFYCIFYKVLDYVTPIAIQEMSALLYGISGEAINNIYLQDPNIRVQYLHINVIPIKNKTVIAVFSDSADKRYRHFKKDMDKLEENDRLALINYLIFLYSDKFFLYPGTSRDILENKKLKNVAVRTDKVIDLADQNLRFLIAKDYYSLDDFRTIPNLLCRENCIKR